MIVWAIKKLYKPGIIMTEENEAEMQRFRRKIAVCVRTSTISDCLLLYPDVYFG